MNINMHNACELTFLLFKLYLKTKYKVYSLVKIFNMI